MFRRHVSLHRVLQLWFFPSKITLEIHFSRPSGDCREKVDRYSKLNPKRGRKRSVNRIHIGFWKAEGLRKAARRSFVADS